MKNKIKTLLVLGAISLFSLSITGCGSSLTTYLTTDFPQAINERGQQNKDIASKLYDAGFIDKTMYDSLCKQIDSQVEVITKEAVVIDNSDVYATTYDKTSTDKIKEDIASSNPLYGMDGLGGTIVDTVIDSNLNMLDPVIGAVADHINEGVDESNKASAEAAETVEEANKESIEYGTVEGTQSETSDKSLVKSDAVKRLGAATSYYWITQPQWVEYQNNDGNSEIISTSDFNNKLVSKVSDINAVGDASLSYFCAGNYIHGQYLGKTDAEVKGYPKTVSEPINFFAGQEDIVESINEKFRAEVWVLDASKIQSDSKSMDEIFAAINEAVKNKDMSGVSNYFVQMKDENGPVHLMDNDFNLIMQSDDNIDSSVNQPGKDLVMTQTLMYCSEGEESCSNKDHIKAEKEPVLSVKFNEFNYNNFETLCETIDMNSGAYYFQTLNDTESSGGQTVRAYVLTYPVSVIDSFELNGTSASATFNDDSGMAVSIAGGHLISYESDGNGGYTKTSHEVNTDDAYLTLNFADTKEDTGKSSLVCNGYRTYDIDLIGSDGGTVTKNVVVPRIILRDYLEATWAPGSTEYVEKLIVFGRKIRFRTDSNFWLATDPLVVIQNGTEKTYNCSTLVYDTSNKDYCALFVDIDGKEIGSLSKLYITDFCDIEKLSNGDASVTTTGDWDRFVVSHFTENNISPRTIPGSVTKITLYLNINSEEKTIEFSDYKELIKYVSGENAYNFAGAYIEHQDNEEFKNAKNAFDEEVWNIKGNTETTEATNKIPTNFTEAGIKNSLNNPLQNELTNSTEVTSIKLSLQFPGRYIGSCDISNYGTQVQRFYCVTTTKGMFDSALYSDWINSSSTKASMTWWNTYLSDHGYQYHIGENELSEYLKKNYSYELNQYGAIILDLDTVATIQEIFDKDSEEARTAMIRTLFVVLGIFLIAYSLILILCWVVDTNVDLGFSLLNKATLGHWIAIQYDEELPSYNNEDHTYINGRKIFTKCLIIIAVAIVLIRVDASEVMLVLVSTFGKVAAWAQDIIQGVAR